MVAFIGAYTSACGSVYVFDVRRNKVRCASPDRVSTGQMTNSFQVAISADGRSVAFSAWNRRKMFPFDGDPAQWQPCAPAGDDACLDVFVHDLDSGHTTVVSTGADRDDLLESGYPSISRNGRFVVFSARGGVFLHDRDVDGDGVFDERGRTKTIRLGRSGNAPTISADGSHIAYQEGNVFRVLDRRAGRETSIAGFEPSFDADGRLVVYRRDERAGAAIYLRDLARGSDTLVSPPDPDVRAFIATNEPTRHPRISADGRFIVFSTGVDLTREADPPRCPPLTSANLYVRDLLGRRTAIVSAWPNGRCMGGGYEGAVSGDGRVIAFVFSERLYLYRESLR